MFEFIPTKIPGLVIIKPVILEDDRGNFVKTLKREDFLAQGLSTDFSETYYSESRKNVIRGMHFQTPPHDYDKVVNCISGRVLDVVLDLRVGSPTYADFFAMEMDGESPRGVYIPSGCAHGFMSLTDHATLLYQVTREYEARHDMGICWNSFGFDWGAENSIVSARDGAAPPLAGFDSPFVFSPSRSLF